MNKTLKEQVDETNSLFVVLILLGLDGIISNSPANKIIIRFRWVRRRYYKAVIAAQ
ncbi:hypothetical protein KA037_03220 [Patescibacteria group bacterium]|nr:hypothetical protein [Patescibacteria group bacterium]MBP7841659.1 hypothetical protein [Patescibacteria group bacterium]